MPAEYFQFGGFRPQIDWFISSNQQHIVNEKALNAIAGPESLLRPKGNSNAPAEVVLGIKPHGSSHLLLTTDEMRLIEREQGLYSRARNPRTLYPHEFESLSPIYFESVDALKTKLSALKPKLNNRPNDTSQANRAFESGGKNPYRGAFEHGRVIFGVLNNTIQPHKYSLDDLPWTRGLRVCSFVFNTKGLDHRTTEQKLNNPIVLDVGFCEAQLPSFEPIYSTARHVVNHRNRTLTAGKERPKKPFSHGSSEEVEDSEMPARVQEFFKDYTRSTEQPMILLVFDKDLTMKYLGKMGVYAEHWQAGLKNLLMPQSIRDRSNATSSSSRPRSTSPRAFQSNRMNERYDDTYISSFSRSVTGARQYDPVFVLDVKQLFVKLMETDQIKDVVDVGYRFGLTDSDWYCAGDEAVLLIDIWKSMVSGLSIDEQRRKRAGSQASLPHTQMPGPSTAQTHLPSASSGSDDEQDPNDIVAQPQAAQRSTSNSGPGDNWDESDYDTNSSSDDD
ncbi:hypothetical protein CPB84DRAFT_1769105 [Gymnopilus junonius]|uniref:Uncharacterized protein n=1 Tax=Gymnopilus junonius TaxID=109634 RepID=A0A9P5TRL0_GYMJU|nr:hypothetical protein CPB84DRAFT_1769105 [Gymnopilus junonius]